jgi:hypothetical protein
MPIASNIVRLIVIGAGLLTVTSPCEAAPHHRTKTAHQRTKKSARSSDSNVRNASGRHKHSASAGDAKPPSSDASLDDLESSPLDTHASPVASGATTSEPAPETIPNESSTALDEESAGDTTPETSAETDAESRARVTLAVAGGATYRLIEIAARDGQHRLDTGWVPAVALDVRAAFGGDRAQVALGAHYETSLHTFGSQHSPDPTSQVLPTPIRSHRFEIGVTPSLRFGSIDSFAAGVFIGYALRAFGSVAELQVPRFTEHGPLLRLELDIPVIGSVLRIRLAPEVSGLVSISRAVRRLGETDRFGIAFGGEASLRLRIVEWLALELDYRESHAFVHSAFADPFRDVERFALLGVRLQF